MRVVRIAGIPLTGVERACAKCIHAGFAQPLDRVHGPTSAQQVTQDAQSGQRRQLTFEAAIGAATILL
jgi:hypothetical protein